MRRALAGLMVLVAACGSGVQEADSGAELELRRRDLEPFGLIEYEWTGTGARVAVLGDSIAHYSRDALHGALGGYQRRIDAVAGEGWRGGSWSAAYGHDLIEASARDIARGEVDVVVWVFGTNDVLRQDDAAEPIDVEESLAELQKTLELFDRDVCIVAVEVNEAAEPALDSEAAARLNDELAKYAQVLVPPLDARLLDEQGIHPTDEGEVVLAERIAAAVDSCP